MGMDFGSVGAGGGGPGASSNNGGVWITDIVPTAAGNVGNKVTSSGGVVLDTATSDTVNVDVSIRAISGDTNYEPNITVEGNAVVLVADPDEPQWTGTVSIVMVFAGGQDSILAVHEDGAIHSTLVTEESIPTITSAVFTGGYPGAQTELKENDTFNLRVISPDLFDTITIADFGACKPQVFGFAATNDQTVAITIDDEGDVAVLRPARLTISKPSGSTSASFDTDSAGAVDGTHLVNVNNLAPTATIGAITYPGAQLALKDVESATIVMVVANADTNTYTSPNGDLTITNPNEPADEAVGTTPKTVTRLAGNYNVTVDNFRVTANRAANDNTTVNNVVVGIAHVFATLAVTEPAARLRSGGGAGTGTVAQDHEITITADQDLLNAPTLVNGGAGTGTFQGGGFVGGPLVWTRDLQVNDSDSKGVQAWGAISGTNLAAKVTAAITGDANYTLGGFVVRTLTIAAWPNREASIETQVSDTAKLVCENLSKGGAGPGGGTIFTFVADILDAVDRFTITEPTTIFNATGNLWYNKDQANAVSNVGGGAQVVLEETV